MPQFLRNVLLDYKSRNIANVATKAQMVMAQYGKKHIGVGFPISERWTSLKDEPIEGHQWGLDSDALEAVVDT